MNLGKILPVVAGIAAIALTGGAAAPAVAGAAGAGAAGAGAAGAAGAGALGAAGAGTAAGLGGLGAAGASTLAGTGLGAGTAAAVGGAGTAAGTAAAAEGAAAGLGSLGAGATTSSVAAPSLAVTDLAAGTTSTLGASAAPAASSGLGSLGASAAPTSSLGSGMAITDPAVAEATGTALTSSMPATQTAAANPSLYDKFMAMPLENKLKMGIYGSLGASALQTMMGPEDTGPKETERDRQAAENAKIEKTSTRSYTAADPSYTLTGGEPDMFSSRQYNFAEGGIATLEPQADPAMEKTLKALRSRYRSRQAAIADIGTGGSVANQLLSGANDPILDQAFGYTARQGKKKKPANGGLQYLAGGGQVMGPGDGMSDSIPAMIDGAQPAQIAQGEYVVPADAVSHLGNGSTDAGAAQLEAMVSRIRAARTGRAKQAPAVNPKKAMPA